MNELRSLVESKILPFVDKPVRYTGSELNIVSKCLETCTVHGVLCFPDLYEIGMSHFGIQMLYHIVNSHPQWALSRCFHPWNDMEKLLREYELPLYSLEYFTPLKQADWVGFSVQYELQYTNILNMLDLAGIPLFASERGMNLPLIIAGGPCMGNPEPLCKYVDVFSIGDGEETIVNICNAIEKEKSRNATKEEFLNRLSEIPGLYIPSIYSRSKDTFFSYPISFTKVKAAKVTSLHDDYYPDKPIVPLMEVVHHRLAVEVMRGCTRGCRFCAAGMWYRPVRERKSLSIFEKIKTGIHSTGWRDVGLLSLSTADYSDLWSLLESLRILKEEQQVHISLPSTRIDALNDEQLDILDKVSPMTSLTIAPEAGSERLRRVINKDFTDDTIYNLIQKLLKKNIQSLKLYFMIGLPTETDEDILAIIQMVTKIAAMARAVSLRKEVHVAISPFSPKPHTPFQRERMESVSTLENKSRNIKNSCKHLKNVKVSYRNPYVTLLETVMARGDENVGNVIFSAWKNGARFDGWDEFFNIERWFEAAKEVGISIEFYCDKIPDEQPLPWNIISTGVTEEFLLSEREKAYRETGTHDCRNGECISCGICDSEVKPIFSYDAVEPVMTRVLPIKKENTEEKLFRYRICYSKGKLLRFLGHLDMSSLIHRAFLMAGVKLAYSKGYHPHPRISFGPPLPLGVFGVNEAFDIITISPLINFERINELLPNDLAILRIESIDYSNKSFFDSVISAHYRFCPLFPIDNLDLEKRIKSLLEKKEVFIQNKKNGTVMEKNIRTGIFSISIEPMDNAFTAELSFGKGKSCKPLELIAALFQERLFSDFLVERVSCNLG